MPEPLLALSGVHTHVGRYHILQGVDLLVPEGGVTVLLGRNGAGKTTTLRTVLGLWRASTGSVRFAGREVARTATPDIARLGIGYVPESTGVFAGLTVGENLRLGTRSGRPEPGRLRRVMELFPVLERKWADRAGTLSGGQKQMLAVGRAMVEEHRLLLVDEPSKGLSPAAVDQLVAALRAAGTTVLLVEQNFHVARSLGAGVAVMDEGRVVHTGTMAALAGDEALQARLLGLSLASHQ